MSHLIQITRQSQQEITEIHSQILDIINWAKKKNRLISQSQIANILGVSREWVNKKIKDLCLLGFIDKTMKMVLRSWGWCEYVIKKMPLFRPNMKVAKAALALQKEVSSHLYNICILFIDKFIGIYTSKLELRSLIQKAFPKSEQFRRKKHKNMTPMCKPEEIEAYAKENNSENNCKKETLGGGAAKKPETSGCGWKQDPPVVKSRGMEKISSVMDRLRDRFIREANQV